MRADVDYVAVIILVREVEVISDRRCLTGMLMVKTFRELHNHDTYDCEMPNGGIDSSCPGISECVVVGVSEAGVLDEIFEVAVRPSAPCL